MATGETDNLIVTRTFDAPRDLVWRAWTEGDRLAQWWGPKGFKMLKSSLELRPGGTYHYGMLAPDGKTEMWGRFVFHEVQPTGLLSFVVSFSDKDGGVQRNPWSPQWPLEVMNEVTLTARGARTDLQIKGYPVNASDAENAEFAKNVKNVQGGFKGTMDGLAEFLAAPFAEDPKEKQIVLTRAFSAPRELVWKAFTSPEHVANWWGPNGFTTTTREMDVQVGGLWRFVMHGPDGTDYPNRIFYLDVVEGERLVYAHGADDGSDRHHHAAVLFASMGGATEVTLRMLFDTAPQAKETAKYAVKGGNETLAKLGEYLRTM